MDGGAWWATVCSVSKSQTGLKQLSMHAHMHIHIQFLSILIGRGTSQDGRWPQFPFEYIIDQFTD